MSRIIYVFERDPDVPRRFYSRKGIASDAWTAMLTSLAALGWGLEELTREGAEEPMISVIAPENTDPESARTAFDAELQKRGVRVKEVLWPS